MPITFIVSGILVLLILFGFINFKYKTYGTYLLLLFSFIMISYFSGDIIMGTYEFNIFSLFVLLMIIFFCVYNLKLELLDFLWLGAIVGIYYTVVNNNFSFLISYNSTFALLLILFSSLFYIYNLKRGLVFVSLLSSMICITSSIVEINNFGFSIINLDLCVDILFDFVLIYLILKLVSSRIVIFKRRVYVKKANIFYNNIFGNSNVYGL